MKIYLLSCADSDEGGGIYECELSENGTLNQTDYFACDRPMYAVLKENKLHVLLCQPLEDDIYSGYFTLNADLTQPSAIKSTLGKCACTRILPPCRKTENMCSAPISDWIRFTSTTAI